MFSVVRSYIEILRVSKSTVVVRDNSTGVRVHTDCKLIKVTVSFIIYFYILT